MKTLIFVWTQKFCNLNVTQTENRYGLGDMLRGTIGALRYCEERGYEFILDMSLHPLSQLFLHKPHRFSNLIQNNKDTIKFIPCGYTLNYIDLEFEGKDLVYFFSNFNLDTYDIPASPYIKERIRDILTPNEMFESYLTELRSKLPRPLYVLHFRLGDECLLLEKNPNMQGYIDFIKGVKDSNPNFNFTLMSDSSKLKELTKDIVLTLEGSPVHVGSDTTLELLKYTVGEFMILREAQMIYTYSVYFWISGFVKLINYIYDVQIQNLKA